MLYTKLRIDFKNGPKDRFYRVILVKGILIYLNCALQSELFWGHSSNIAF